MAPEYQRYVFDLIMEAGAEHDIRLVGSRALNALRLERILVHGRVNTGLLRPVECGLSRFVHYDKEADFIGKDGAIAEKADGGKMRLRSFIIEAKDADVIGDEPIALDGDVCGWVTSGGYAHGSGVSVAMGYVPKMLPTEMMAGPSSCSVRS